MDIGLAITKIVVLVILLVMTPGIMGSNSTEVMRFMKPVDGQTEYRNITEFYSYFGTNQTGNIKATQLCNDCTCRYGSTYVTVACCYGVRCQPNGVCGLAPVSCSCSSCGT